MIVIVSIVVVSAATFAWTHYQGFWKHDLLGFVSASILAMTLITWGILTVLNLTCLSLGDSYQLDTRFDWLTGCMVPLEDGREIQVDSDSIALVVREVLDR